MSDSKFRISTAKSELDVTAIHHFLSTQSYWAKGRSLETVKKSIENSLCFGGYLGSKQVGFARVVSDYAIFAWIMDVFILPEYRGRGYSKELMRAIVGNAKLQNLQRWGLGTEDAHGLYAQFGFSPIAKPANLMEIVRKPQ